ncbi:MAG: insulinase family protein [Candidatus Omnitrophica bacterium]|nr:insulinase family protein [Candidatus Omnitrophota bacterium]
MAAYTKIELENGLKVACLPMPNMESVSLGIWLNAGGRYEEESLSGVSHFLEHLVFRGTKKRTARQIKESIEGIGGMLNAFTAEEMTCYFVKIPSRYLKLSLDVLSDMVLSARLDSNDIEKERTVILEEIKMYMDLPMHYVQELLSQLLWPKHPLGMFLCGTFETISTMKREDIVSYRDRFYQPQHINVVACGNLEKDKFLELAKKIFSRIRRGAKINFKKAGLKQNGVQTNFTEKDTEQTHVALGVHGLPRGHRDRHALTLLHIILGANMSSRLFQEVREKRGLAYEIGTHLKKFQDTGAFIVNAGVEHKKTSQAIQVIIQELVKIKNKPVTQSEFKRAKEYFTGQFLLALEETMEHMLWLGENVAMMDKVYTPSEVLRELNRVNMDDLQRVASSIFKTNGLNLALIGPISDKDRKDIVEALVL